MPLSLQLSPLILSFGTEFIGVPVDAIKREKKWRDLADWKRKNPDKVRESGIKHLARPKERAII